MSVFSTKQEQHEEFFRTLCEKYDGMSLEEKKLFLLHIMAQMEHDCCHVEYVRRGFPYNSTFLKEFIKGKLVPFNPKWFNSFYMNENTPSCIRNSMREHMLRSNLPEETLLELNDKFVENEIVCLKCKRLYKLASKQKREQKQEVEPDPRQEEKEENEEPTLSEDAECLHRVEELVLSEDAECLHRVEELVLSEDAECLHRVEEYVVEKFGKDYINVIKKLLSFTSKHKLMMYLIDEFDKMLFTRFGSSVKTTLFETPLSDISDIDLASEEPETDVKRIVKMLSDIGLNVSSTKRQKYLISVCYITYRHSVYEEIKGSIDMIDIKHLNSNPVAVEHCLSIEYNKQGQMKEYYGDLRVFGPTFREQKRKLKHNIINQIVTLLEWDSKLTIKEMISRFKYINKLRMNKFDIVNLGFANIPFIPNMSIPEFLHIFCGIMSNTVKGRHIMPLSPDKFCTFPKELGIIMTELIGVTLFRNRDENPCDKKHYGMCNQLFYVPCCKRKICMNRLEVTDTIYENYKCCYCKKS